MANPPTLVNRQQKPKKEKKEEKRVGDWETFRLATFSLSFFLFNFFLLLCIWKQMMNFSRLQTHFYENNNKPRTTFNGGSLGSCIDEERSKLRYVM